MANGQEDRPAGGASRAAPTKTMPPAEDAYLVHFLGALALHTALKKGVIDQLSKAGAMGLSELQLEPRGGTILMQMLVDAGVCQRGADGGSDDTRFGLAPDFARDVLARRGILEQKLEFLRLAAHDLLDGMPDLLFDLPRFMERSRTFALFRYDKAMDTEPESLAHTRRWADYVTALTEAEAAALVPEIDLAGHAGLLDIGGNTGAFALRLLQAYPELKATVMDLPAVCRLGEEFARDRPGASRLRFVPGDARRDTWPGVGGQPADAVLFKSVLHDWPESEARLLLDRAHEVLPPGGRLVVCERAPLEDELTAGGDREPLPFSMAANLVFAPFYRPAAFYEKELDRRGFTRIEVRHARVEMPFNIVAASKSDAGP